MQYNNKFLKMYFTDLCSLYFAQRELKSRISIIKEKIEDARTEEYYRCPQAPQDEPLCGCGTVIGLIFGAFMFFTPLIGFLSGDITGEYGLIVLVAMAIGGFALWAVGRAMWETKENNENRRYEYEEACRVYYRETKELKELKEKERSLIPSYQAQLTTYREELRKIKHLIERAYNVNIVPLPYRDIYASLYLYNYFIGSREVDLAVALNTYVLEQIKAKLDEMIAMQGEMILNQRIMIANQEREIQNNNDHHNEMKREIRRMEANVEEHMEIMRTNTAVSAFFSAANYFKK